MVVEGWEHHSNATWLPSSLEDRLPLARETPLPPETVVVHAPLEPIETLVIENTRAPHFTLGTGIARLSKPEVAV